MTQKMIPSYLTMANHKRGRTPSERSVSSLSDTTVRVGRKAKQVAIKTVKSLTALIKKPRKSHIVPDSECKAFVLASVTRIYLFTF